MKPRHWKILLKKIKITSSFSEVTMANLWDQNLLKFEK
jgi:hypothetical protein